LIERVRRLLPEGGSLPEASWRQRHRGIVTLLFLHAVGIVLYGLLVDVGWAHALGEGSIVALAGALAVTAPGRRAQTAAASFGLLTASALLVHLSNGYIEVHFHFFVVIGVIALYQDWLPLLLAIGYVLVEHGIVGVLVPSAVYNHPGALAEPWKWAAIHAGFVLAASAACIANWRLSEQERERTAYERVARAEAEARMRVADEFLSVAAHELKTPITSLRGYAQLLRRYRADGLQADPGRLERAVKTIELQSARLSQLVEQLLDISRIRAGRLMLNFEPSDLVTLIAQVVDVARVRTDAHRLVFVTDEASLPGLLDPLRLEQVITNLLDNAIKYSPAGGEIRVELARTSTGELRIAVCDQGLGVPAEQRGRIFDRFYQVSDPQAHRSGLGLGLHIAREIVELHGGSITAEFPADGGSRFMVLLPGPDQVPAPAYRLAMPPPAPVATYSQT
jgi:signal transduction histidine kinase